MQLDPNAHLVGQLRGLSSTALERLTAATFASIGYTVHRNLRYALGGQTVAEVDVHASVLTPLRESRVLFECKGGIPSFVELRNFASLRQLLSAPPDELVVICRDGTPQNRYDAAAQLGIRLVEKSNLAYYVLPLLGGGSLRHQRARELNRYLAWHTVHEFFVARVGAHATLHHHYRFLMVDLWKIGEPNLQASTSFKAYETAFRGTSDTVAQALGTTGYQALMNPVHDDVEAAMYIMLVHRIMNAWAVARWTLEIMQSEDSVYLVKNLGSNLGSAVSQLSSHPRLLFGFPAFLQTYFFVWGGFILDARRTWEIQRMAEETATTPAAIEHYLAVLDAMYTGGAGSMNASIYGCTSFKYVPAAVRGLGITHRRAVDPGYYSGAAFFGTLGAAYGAALDRALAAIGGVASLRY